MPLENTPNIPPDWWARFGSAFAFLAAAVAGRMMFHAEESRAGRRRFFSAHLAYEGFVALGMWSVSYGLAEWYGLELGPALGLTTFLAWLGPRGAMALADRYLARRAGRAEGGARG